MVVMHVSLTFGRLEGYQSQPWLHSKSRQVWLQRETVFQEVKER